MLESVKEFKGAEKQDSFVCPICGDMMHLKNPAGDLFHVCDIPSETIVLSEADHVGHIKLDRAFSIDSVRYQSYSDMQEMHDILALMPTDLLG